MVCVSWVSSSLDGALTWRKLESIGVERSPICRPGSDCWDVKLTFFDPTKREGQRQASRLTIDVSEVVPVMVGTVRSWTEY